MVDGGVREAPYATVHALGGWAEYRWGYLTGRLLLAGVDIDSLDGGQIIDVAEAAMLEPHLHGGMVTIDEALNKFDTRIREVFPTPETWGEGPEAEQQAALFEQMFPMAVPNPPEPEPPDAPEEPTLPPDEP